MQIYFRKRPRCQATVPGSVEMLRQVYNSEQRVGARSSQCCSLLSQVRFVRFISLDYLIVKIICLLGLSILGSNRPVTTLKNSSEFSIKKRRVCRKFPTHETFQRITKKRSHVLMKSSSWNLTTSRPCTAELPLTRSSRNTLWLLKI